MIRQSGPEYPTVMDAGIYPSLSNPDYHAEADWIGSSQLKALLPDHFKGVSVDTPAKDFGSAFHTTVLGVGDEIEFVDAATWQGKAAKEEQEAIRSRGHTPVLKRDWPTIEGMAAAVTAHREASALLAGSAVELSVFAEVDGVPSKCRFDALTDDGVGVDLKSSADGPGVYELTRTVIKYGFDLSEAHYEAVASAAGIVLSGFRFVICSKEPPHYVTVVELDAAFLARGDALRDLALNRYLHPDFTPAYPGETELLTLALPRWAALD